MHKQLVHSTHLSCLTLVFVSDLYEDQISSSRTLHDIFAQIRSTLTAEHELAVSALELMGTLDVIMSASTFVNSADASQHISGTQ